MKASIGDKGTMTITPENSTEGFALKHWINQFNNGVVDITMDVDPAPPFNQEKIDRNMEKKEITNLNAKLDELEKQSK